MKKITILSLFIIAGCVAFGQFALADTSVLSVTPSSGNKDIGSLFDVSIQLDPAGNEACVVKGTLNFNNLSCQNITLAIGVAAQTVPNCQSPSFVLGIPKCATTLQDMMTLSVKGIDPGQSDLSFSDVSVLNSSATVDVSLNGGIYNITAVSGLASAVQQVPPASTEVGPDNTTQETTSEEIVPTEEAETFSMPQEENNEEAQPAALGESELPSFFSNWIVWLIIIILLAAIIWWFSSKKENGEKKEGVQK